MGIDLTTRAGKGSALNATEHDANLAAIAAAIDPEHNTDGTHKSAAIISGGGILHSLAVAANDFLIASGTGAFVKKTLAEAKAILGLDQDVKTTSSPTFARFSNTAIIPFTDGDTTPSVAGGNVFSCNYTNPVTITAFDDSVPGQIIIIYFGGSATVTVDRTTSYLAGGANFVSTAYDILALVQVGSAWREISRSANS